MQALQFSGKIAIEERWDRPNRLTQQELDKFFDAAKPLQQAVKDLPECVSIIFTRKDDQKPESAAYDEFVPYAREGQGQTPADAEAAGDQYLRIETAGVGRADDLVNGTVWMRQKQDESLADFFARAVERARQIPERP